MVRKVLIIDDSSTVRSIIAKMVAPIGFSVLHAANGQEALTVLASNPDTVLAFVDWNMPVMNGIQFVRAVRAETQYASLKLIMVTTETEMLQVETALTAGVDEYVMKPFTAEMIVEKLGLIGISPEQRGDT